MKTEIYSNGFRSTWDDTITVGCLITARTPGFHVVTRIDYREGKEGEALGVRLIEGEAAPVIYYVKILNADGSKVTKPGKEVACHAAWCRQLTTAEVRELWIQEQAKLNTKFNNLAELVGLPPFTA